MYVTDTLQTIAENTAISANKFLDEPAGKVMTRRWIGEDKPTQPKETRTEQEIIDSIAERARA